MNNQTRANISHVLLNQYAWSQIVALDPEAARAVRVGGEIMILVAQRHVHTSIQKRYGWKNQTLQKFRNQ